MKDFFQISDFVCGYSDKFVLDRINIAIEKGSFSGIIGPNGSGKTTLFRGITGELVARSGSITLDGEDLRTMKLREKARKLAIVTQHIEAGQVTVEEYVLMGRMPYRNQLQFFETARDFEVARKYMELTDTWRLRDKFMNALSGGEQQLAGIARALAQEPKLLLLDEPTSHLDITNQVQILNLIQRLSHDLNLTVVMIVHDLNLAGEYCDSLIMMSKGGIQKMGTPMEVLNYKDIEAVYNTVVVTRTNPISKKPVVFLISEKTLSAQK